MDHHVLSVPDISCQHCKAAIEAAVGRLDGVDAVTVDVAAKTVTVVATTSLAAINDAIVDAGYDVAGAA